MKTDYRCKFCGHLGTATADESCTPEWAATLAPMLVCNPCADRRRRRRDAEHALFAACNQINFRRSGSRPPESEKWLRTLNAATREFAEAIRVERGRRELVWSAEFAELLWDAPDRCGQLLAHYLRGLPVEAPVQAHFPDP